MKWMGWSWEDLMETPREVVDEVISMINEEAEELERIRSQNAS